MIKTKYKRVFPDTKQELRNIVIHNLQKFLSINRRKDVIISTLPSTSWIVENEIPSLAAKCNFRGKITCLFYEKLKGRHGAEYEKFFQIGFPENICCYYINSLMPTPCNIHNLFNCPIFFWGDYCCEYTEKIIAEHIKPILTKNSVMFLTFALKNNFVNLDSQKAISEFKDLIFDIDNIIAFNETITQNSAPLVNYIHPLKYRSKKMNMVFFGLDNFDYSHGEAKIYDMFYNINKTYDRKWTVPQLRVLFRKPEEEIKYIVNC